MFFTLRLTVTNDLSLAKWSFLLKGQMLRCRGHYVSLCIHKAFIVTSRITSDSERGGCAPRMRDHLQIINVVFGSPKQCCWYERGSCVPLRSKPLTNHLYLLLLLYSSFSPFWPTPKKLSSKFIFSTVSSRTGSMRLFLTQRFFRCLRDASHVKGLSCWRVLAIFVAL